METRNSKKRKDAQNASGGSAGGAGASSSSPPTQPPVLVTIPKHPTHIFYNDDDEDDDMKKSSVPPLLETESEEEEEVKPVDKRYKTIPPKKKYDDEDDYEEDIDDDDEYDDDDDDDEDEDEDDDEDEWDDDVQNLDDEDVRALEKLRREQPKLFDRFTLAKEIIKSRELSIFDILKAEVSDDKRANLIEEYEILRQTQPCTGEYIEQRDKLRNQFFRYIAESLVPPRASATSSSSSSSHPAPSPFRIQRTDTQVEAANMRKKLALINMSDANHKVLEEKLDEFEDIDRGEEKTKIKRWINLALQLPFDRLTTNLSLSSAELTERLKLTEEHFNRRLFGMHHVKERLMLFLNKKLREGNSRGCNIALVGKPGVGKCLHPDTPVRMWDMTVKRAVDVRTGDLLLGDDSRPRAVLSTVTGSEAMYEISQQYGDTYTVNESHILSMRHRVTGEVEDIPVAKFVSGEKLVDQYRPYSTSWCGDITDERAFELGQKMAGKSSAMYLPLPELCLHWTMETKMQFFGGFMQQADERGGEWMIVRIARNRPYRAVLELLRSAGVRCKVEPLDDGRYLNLICHSGPNEQWRIVERGVGNYAGFVIDGNHRFVLGDFTVTHNTAIAKSLAECLQIPFAQLSFGGVSNSEFLMGHDYTYIGSRPGEISRCMTRLGVKNGILFFDEFDKVTDKKEIMSTLLHITDFSQNNEFRDSYFPELTQDLSKVWFIYSMNQLPTDPAMLDRLEVVHVDEYSTEERVQIAQQYLFGKYVKELKIESLVVLEQSGASKLVHYSSGGMDKKGVRELERLMNLVIEKVYFYISNPDAVYTYPWFKKTRQNVDAETGQVHIDDNLVEAILADKRREWDSRHMYLNMYI